MEPTTTQQPSHRPPPPIPSLKSSLPPMTTPPPVPASDFKQRTLSMAAVPPKSQASPSVSSPVTKPPVPPLSQIRLQAGLSVSLNTNPAPTTKSSSPTPRRKFPTLPSKKLSSPTPIFSTPSEERSSLTRTINPLFNSNTMDTNSITKAGFFASPSGGEDGFKKPAISPRGAHPLLKMSPRNHQPILQSHRRPSPRGNESSNNTNNNVNHNQTQLPKRQSPQDPIPRILDNNNPPPPLRPSNSNTSTPTITLTTSTNSTPTLPASSTPKFSATVVSSSQAHKRPRIPDKSRKPTLRPKEHVIREHREKRQSALDQERDAQESYEYFIFKQRISDSVASHQIMSTTLDPKQDEDEDLVEFKIVKDSSKESTNDGLLSVKVGDIVVITDLDEKINHFQGYKKSDIKKLRAWCPIECIGATSAASVRKGELGVDKKSIFLKREETKENLEKFFGQVPKKEELEERNILKKQETVDKTEIDNKKKVLTNFLKKRAQIPTLRRNQSSAGKTSNNNTGVFGMDWKKLGLRDGIPNIVIQCVRYIEQNGTDAIGLFRIAGKQVEKDNLVRYFHTGEERLEDYRGGFDVHAVAAVLKQYLRDLPEPLFPFDSYEPFMELVRRRETNTQAMWEQEIEKCVDGFVPKKNEVFLNYIMSFLKRVSDRSGQNLMTVSNLAIIFAPNLLRPKLQTAMSAIEENQKLVELCVVFITWGGVRKSD